MLQQSGIESAVQELEKEGKRIQEIISMLRKLQAQRSAAKPGGKRTRRRLSAKARRRISEAAKKRWAARRASKG